MDRPLRTGITRQRRPEAARPILLLLGGFAMLAGLDGALVLLGVPAPVDAVRLASVHGPLMVFGFVGTVVVLERAVALRRSWAYVSPALLGLGGIALVSPMPLIVGQLALVGGTAALLVIYAALWRRQPSTSAAIQCLGAVAAVNTAIMWAGGISVPQLAPGMTVFLLLTIAGERLELARISPTVNAAAERWMLACAIALTTGALAAVLWPSVGYPLLAVALTAMIVWFFRYDVATRLIRSLGMPRYMAACLLAGYVWLIVPAALWLFAGPTYAGPGYDAVLHSVFLGFVFSMIMAHAPTILPAVLRRPLPYRPVMYGPVILLHASLLARILLGDAGGLPELVVWGGVANIVAVLAFVAIAAGSVIVGAPARASGAQRMPSPVDGVEG